MERRHVRRPLLARRASSRAPIAGDCRGAVKTDRIRLVRQFLTEGVLLALLGGILGMLAGLWAERAMKELIPLNLPTDVGLDPRILASMH